MDSFGKLVRFVDHAVKHPADLITLTPQIIVFLLVDIPKILSEIQPDFRLSDFPRGIYDLADKQLTISSFFSGLSDISGYTSRRTSHLICEGEFLFLREHLGHLLNLQGQIVSHPVDFQVPVPRITSLVHTDPLSCGYSLLLAAYCLLPSPYSLLPTPYCLLFTPYSLLFFIRWLSHNAI